MSINYSKLGNKATNSDNQSEDKVFERELPATGATLMRFVGYIETGRHASKKVKYKPSLQVKLIFELNTTKHLIEIEGKKVPQLFYISLPKGLTAASGYKKIFQQMNTACGGGKTHFFQMLGYPFMGTMYHNDNQKTGADHRVYANLDAQGAYSFTKPEQEDAITEEIKKIPVAEVYGDITGFIWENEDVSDEEYVEMYDNLFIEGTKEKDGKTVSKNWIQELIMSNLDWEGSTLQALVEETVSLDELATEPLDLKDVAVNEPVPEDIVEM